MKNDTNFIEEVKDLISKKLIEEEIFPTVDFDPNENVEIDIDPN